MENSPELTPEQLEKYFEYNLRNAPEGARNRYYTLLVKEQLEKAKENNGKPQGSVSLELRENLLRIAKITRDNEEARNLLKMDKAWEGARSKDGRPPIGGAQDD